MNRVMSILGYSIAVASSTLLLTIAWQHSKPNWLNCLFGGLSIAQKIWISLAFLVFTLLIFIGLWRLLTAFLLPFLTVLFLTIAILYGCYYFFVKEPLRDFRIDRYGHKHEIYQDRYGN